jgi:hypothetical protein
MGKYNHKVTDLLVPIPYVLEYEKEADPSDGKPPSVKLLLDSECKKIDNPTVQVQPIFNRGTTEHFLKWFQSLSMSVYILISWWEWCLDRPACWASGNAVHAFLQCSLEVFWQFPVFHGFLCLPHDSPRFMHASIDGHVNMWIQSSSCELHMQQPFFQP